MLCPAVAERQGETAGHGTHAEVELLTVHGILHLLGYDHAEPEEHAEMFGLQDRLLAEWRAVRADATHPDRALNGDRRPVAARRGRRPRRRSPGSSRRADAALSSFSRARADELLAEGRAGARRLTVLLDDPARYLNTALLLRLLCEIAAT